MLYGKDKFAPNFGTLVSTLKNSSNLYCYGIYYYN